MEGLSLIGIYPRVSTEEQAKSGFSIDSQIREARKKAGTNDVKIYADEGYSGEYLERPGMNQLRKDVRDGLITKIICLDPDRLARKLMLQLIITDEFEKRGVELVFVNGEYAKTTEGQLFYSMRGAISEFEKAKINQRMTSGRREKAQQGKVIKNSFIYGYDYDKANSRYVINEYEATVVHLIFNLFTKPNDLALGINGIAKYLTEQKIPTKRGAKVWHKQVVRQICFVAIFNGMRSKV
jgi:site-specific DNA recombinase